MSPEFILQAAVSSMVRGHHKPHCFSAWERGKGYTNKGHNELTRYDYLVQLERSATQEIDNLGYAQEYAEPGYENPKKGILFANWNKFPRKVAQLLEKYGYECEWSDEWAICDDCNGAVRTSPSGWGWKPNFVLHDDYVLCTACNSESED